MSQSQRAETGSAAALGAIVTGALIITAAATIVHTVVPLRMALEQRPPLLIGLVGSAYSLGFLAGCFLSPGLIRRVGHIRSFAVFSALQAIMTISLALLPVEWWGVPRLIMGAAAAGHAVCIESWISGQASSSHRGRLFGLYQILNRASLIGSQIAVGYAAIAMENVVLLASAAFSLALIPVSLTKARSPEAAGLDATRLGTLWAHAPAAVVGCLYVGLVGGSLTAIAPAYGILIGLDQKASVVLAAATQIGSLLMQWPMGFLADRLDARIIMLSAALVVTLAAGMLVGLPSVPWLDGRLWQFVLFGLVGGGTMPLYTVAVVHAYHRMGPDGAIGLSASLLLLWGLGSALGPLLATGFMQLAGPQGLLIYLVLLSAGVAFYLAVRLRRKPSAIMPGIERSSAPPMPDIAPGGKRH